MASLLQRFTRANLPDPEQVAAMTMSSWPQSSTDASVRATFPAFALNGYCANSVVFSVVQARMFLLAQAEFKWQDKTSGKLITSPELDLLAVPWANGTSSDLIARMEQYASLAGNAYARRTGAGTVHVWRPDWVDAVNVIRVDGYDDQGEARTFLETLGYLYSDGGIGVGEAVFYPVEQVAHWSPIPDPFKPWRGMSWMTPVLREINADLAMTQHRQTFFDQAGTPNLILKYQQKLTPDVVASVRDRWRARYSGPSAAGSTVVLDEGADLTVVGSSFESMRFTDLQSAGEARISAAGGVPPIVAHLQAGLDASTYSNYGQAIKSFAAGTGSYLWRSLVAALSVLVKPPNGGLRLWYDTANMPSLRQDETDRTTNMQTMASTASTLLAAGYTPESITTYLATGDLAQLQHSGLVSVQLYKAEAKTEAAIPASPPPPVEPATVNPPTVTSA